MLKRIGDQCSQINDKFKFGKDRIFKPLVNVLPRQLLPNHITLFRFVIALIWLPFALLRPTPAQIIIFFVVYFFDLLDGALARLRNRVTYFGEHFDIFSDQINHIALFVTISGLTHYQFTALKFLVGWESLLTLFIVVKYFLKISQLDYIRSIGQFCVRTILCLILIYEIASVYGLM